MFSDMTCSSSIVIRIVLYYTMRFFLPKVLWQKKTAAGESDIFNLQVFWTSKGFAKPAAE